MRFNVNETEIILKSGREGDKDIHIPVVDISKAYNHYLIMGKINDKFLTIKTDERTITYNDMNGKTIFQDTISDEENSKIESMCKALPKEAVRDIIKTLDDCLAKCLSED